MKRVCAIDVVNAYKATGLIPIRKAWTTTDQRGGCAIDALARYTTEYCGEQWADDNLEPNYLRGFLDAWDADEPQTILEQEDNPPQNYVVGYWDAILCRDAVHREFDSISEVEAN
jgi:hypothetical protein